jgi:uncharacterized protein YeaO (DUF488 family)
MYPIVTERAEAADMARRKEPAFTLQRIYEDDLARDSYRVLVDRLWPRGIKKEDADLDEWAKDLAPSTELRRWYGHEVAKFDEFACRYRDELSRPPCSTAVAQLRERATHVDVTLLTATKDLDHSGARVLYEHLLSRES